MTTTFEVTGMTCGHCVTAVTEELSNLPTVAGVSVNLVPGGRSAVTVTSDEPLAAEDIAGALDDAGEYRLAGDDLAGN